MKNSDINGEKAVAILKAVLKHDLQILEFSSCTIGDKGMTAVAKLILDVPIAEIILPNNQIGKYQQYKRKHVPTLRKRQNEQYIVLY